MSAVTDLRRRLRLGLVEPEVVARILLWGIGSGCASVLIALYAWLWLQRPGLVPSFEEVALIAVPGIGAAVSVWLAFFPPAAWRRRFAVRFHLVAIAFLIFDVELLFVYPWAVASRSAAGIDRAVQEGWVADRGLVLGGVMFFLALVVAGLVYEWRKGVLEWR